MAQHFRQRLQQGDLLFGTGVTLSSPAVSELLAQAGFDWLFLDAEHAPLEPGALQSMLQAAGATQAGGREVACIIRVPALTEADIKHALDIGATGVVVPQVHTPELAALAVQYARYHPAGRRGMGVYRANGYGFQVSEYLQQAAEGTVVVVQAESAEAVRNIDRIVQVPGLDAVLIGPYDLSASLGHPGDLAHPDFRDAVDHITSACQAHGMPLGIFGMNAEAVRPYMARGYRLILMSVDTLLLGQAARELLRSAKS
jgi:2-keto-3-deoxy-L-rhamnonate aldolase RhmA